MRDRYEKMSWLQNIRQMTGLHDVQSLIHAARNRKAMENMITNIHEWIRIRRSVGVSIISSSNKIIIHIVHSLLQEGSVEVQYMWNL